MKFEQEYKLPFEKLQVWHNAKDFTKKIYEVTKSFPGSELYGLANQMKRAAVSVMSNIAEGSSRTSRKDQAHFSQLSYSSLMEVACQLQLARELDFCCIQDYEALRSSVMELSAKINALRRYQLKEIP